MDHIPPESGNFLFLTGIYSRVARQLNVHPSYVSRVARGERRSDRVSRAIALELEKLKSTTSSADSHSQDEWQASRQSALIARRRKLMQVLKSDARVRRVNAVVLDAEETPSTNSRRPPKQVSPSSLSPRLAANARLIAVTVVNFERLSKRLERIPHVLSLLDAGGVVLYSTGTTGMARREHRIPGIDWSRDFKGPSAGARAIASGVPVVVIGAVDQHNASVPTVRIGCPVRLSDASIAGALVLTTELLRCKTDHLIQISNMAKRVCKFVENGPIEAVRRRDYKSRVKPFADAARNVALVLSLPQIDSATRASLSTLLADLENRSVRGAAPRKTRGRSQAKGA
jgi:hypothetical protein